MVTLVGPMADRTAQALAALEGIPVTVFAADGVESRSDWWTIEVRTRLQGLPTGTIVDTRSGTCRLSTILAPALTKSGDRIVAITGIDRVPADALNGLRSSLDPTMPHAPPSGRPASPDTLVMLTAERLSTDVLGALEGRLGSVIELA